jgi:tight adherence protein C
MIVIALSVAVLLIASTLVAVHSIRLGRRGTTQAVASLTQYGYGSALVTPRQTRNREQNLALERRLAGLARRLSRDDYEQHLRLRLLQAGLYSFRASRFLMIRMVSAIFLTTLALLHARSPGNPALTALEIVAAPALGWLLPDSFLSMRIRRRLERIERGSADMIDLLAISVRAGQGLDQALKVGTERLQGPLADDLRLMLNEIRVGQSRAEALRRLAERADTPTMRAFTRSMAQSETMGVSVGETLKALALDARTRRRQHAEERAQKAPIKMVFPLAACFFPAILIIAAGPGVLAVVHALGSG